MKVLNNYECRNSLLFVIFIKVYVFTVKIRHYMSKDQGIGYNYLINGWCSATKDAWTVTDTTERWK